MLSLRMVCSKSINRFTMVLLVYNGIRYIKQRSQGQFRMAKIKIKSKTLFYECKWSIKMKNWSTKFLE